MNLYSNQTLTQIRHSLNLNTLYWMIAPVAEPFHYEDLVGDVEEAYASDEPIHLPAALDMPEVSAEAFEREYGFFLS